MRRPLIAGNWKMHGSLATTNDLLTTLLNGISDGVNAAKPELAVFPPYVYLAETARLLAASPIAWGAQNLSEHASGAYTGEVAGAMLSELGCRYVLVGHSERRALYGETDAQLNAKLAAAQRAGLTPILCVGETLVQREQGSTETVVGQQLDAGINGNNQIELANLIIAYEPVWAIGTGKTATPEQAQTVHAFIRSRIASLDATIANSIRILYGGSVKPDNAGTLLSQTDIDGGLVGGASLDGASFLAIANAV